VTEPAESQPPRDVRASGDPAESQPPRDAGEPPDESPDQLDPEQLQAVRRASADKATRRALSALLCLEAFSVLLVPRALAQTPGGLGGTKTALLIGFAVLLVVAAALLRRPWMVGAGSLLQLPMIGIGLWIHAFFIVAALFVGVWLYTLNLRHEIAGTPGGLRMLSS
jgi:Protein of unknown function (DUF4233)